jgi:AsmA protein
MPLLTRNIQVKTFVVESPRVLLEKKKDGTANWETLGGAGRRVKPEKKETPAGSPESGGQLPVKSLAVGNFAITNGVVRFKDKAAGLDKEIKDIKLVLRDLDLTSPVGISFKAFVDKVPVSIEGKVGPVGREPGKGTIPLDLTFEAAKQLQMNLAGSVTDAASRKYFDMNLSVSEFSLKKLFSALDQSFPFQTTDPEVLRKISLNTRIKGTSQAVSLSEGRLILDDTEAAFTASAGDFSKPDVGVNIQVDRFDLDRYMPPDGKEKEGGDGAKQKSKKTEGKSETIDYEPLRSLVLDGRAAVGRLKAYGAKMQDIVLEVTGKNGVFLVDPLKMNLYQGNVVSKAELDVRKNTPSTRVFLEASGVKAGPLLKDTTGKNLIEGTMMSDIDLSMKGQDPGMIKKTLNGGGKLVFNDGAIVGVDIAGMVRNAKSGMGLSRNGKEKPRTDFTELRIPFDVTDGVVDTAGTGLKSPLLRVSAAGKANLVNSTLDFRVEPKVVGTLKGQGDIKERSGIVVPILVTGTFSSPKYRLDLEGMMKSETPDTESIKKAIEDKDLEKKTSEDVKKQAEEAFKGFLKQSE